MSGESYDECSRTSSCTRGDFEGEADARASARDSESCSSFGTTTASGTRGHMSEVEAKSDPDSARARCRVVIEALIGWADLQGAIRPEPLVRDARFGNLGRQIEVCKLDASWSADKQIDLELEGANSIEMSCGGRFLEVLV